MEQVRSTLLDSVRVATFPPKVDQEKVGRTIRCDCETEMVRKENVDVKFDCSSRRHQDAQLVRRARLRRLTIHPPKAELLAFDVVRKACRKDYATDRAPQYSFPAVYPRASTKGKLQASRRRFLDR
jgi:hypothetical protein